MSTSQVTPQDGETTEQMYKRLYESAGTSTQTTQVVRAEIPEELTSTLSAMRAELTELKQNVNKPTAVVTPEVKQAWVEKIKLGDYEGAERVMAEALEKRFEGKFAEIQQKTYNDAVSAAEANYQMREYVNRVKSENPDVAQFERYLEAPVAQRIESARQAGKIRNMNDFVQAHKAAIDAEVAEIRNKVLQFRAAGKDEALTRKREVLSSTAVTPQQVNSNQIIPPGSDDNQGESMEAYFARRRSDESRRRGLN